MITVSYSKVSSYRGCPQKYNWRYVQGLRPRKVSRPLSFGSDFHKLLECRINPDLLAEAKKSIEEKYYELTASQQEDLGENYLETLFNQFEDYQKRWKNAVVPTITEHEFYLPLGKFKGEDVVFHGIIDELYFDEESGVIAVIGEHKTFSKKPDMSILAMNTQVCLYAKAVQQEFGMMPTKVRWDYIKSESAKEPIWLEKSQRFSEASNSGITPYSWERACARKGITDEAILSKASLYEHNIDNFFFRCEMDIHPEMVESIYRDFKNSVKDMLSKGETNATKHVCKDCAWCEYQPLCYGQFTGADLEYIVQKDYTYKEN
jgi:hypothetical protein